MFTRIGLRYLDVISRNRLGLEEVLWSDLIRQSALGLLAEDDIPIADLNETGSISTMKIDGGNVTCRYGLAKTEATGEESVFIVDTDFYASVPLKEVKHASDLLDKFNRSAGQAFRWFICPKLHDALGPKRPD